MAIGSALLLSLGHSLSSLALPSPPPHSLSLPVAAASPTTPASHTTPTALANPPKAIAPSPYISPTVSPTPFYSQPQIDYFLDIAMGSEYGNATPHIRKWATDLNIKIHGTPTAQDMVSLERVVDELNTLIDPIDLNILNEVSYSDTLELGTIISPEAANVNIHFVPYTDFANYVPHYQSGNLGYAWIWWQNDMIYDATILISTTGINQMERSHLIREELTQSLGLLQDSYQYEDSIFFQLWTTTTRYSDLDEALIRILYSSKIQSGMTRQAVINALGDGTIQAANAAVSDHSGIQPR